MEKTPKTMNGGHTRIDQHSTVPTVPPCSPGQRLPEQPGDEREDDPREDDADEGGAMLHRQAGPEPAADRLADDHRPS